MMLDAQAMATTARVQALCQERNLPLLEQSPACRKEQRLTPCAWACLTHHVTCVQTTACVLLLLTPSPVAHYPAVSRCSPPITPAIASATRPAAHGWGPVEGVQCCSFLVNSHPSSKLFTPGILRKLWPSRKVGCTKQGTAEQGSPAAC